MSTHNQDTPANIELPVVACIICNYNYGSTIEKCVETAIQQDYPNRKIFIVDDASKDNSWDIITKLKEKYPDDIEIIQSKQNRGPSYSRNTAIKIAANDCQLFAILDADDYWLPSKLSLSVLEFLKDPEIGAVYSDNLVKKEGCEFLTREFRESFDYYKLRHHNMVHSGCVISKNALQESGLYDENLRVAEDYDLWLRIGKHRIIRHIPQPLVVIGVGRHNTNQSVSRDIWNASWEYIRRKHAPR